MATDTEYVLVTEYFHPDTASTGQLMTDLAVGLTERGLDVTVYTGQPNYHSGENQRQPTVTTHEGVTVRRIRAPQLRQSSLAKRLINWLVFTGWMFVVLLFDSTDQRREVIFVSNPPFLPPALWVVCHIRGWEYTAIVYDLYPDAAVELGHVGRQGVLHRMWEWLTVRTLRHANHVVSLGPAMKRRICAKGAIDPEKVRIIHNWEDESFIVPRSKEENWFSQEHDLVDRFTILYSGNIAEFHDLETLVRAAAEMDEREVQVMIIGEGDAKRDIVEIAEATDVRGSTVSFLPYQPLEDLPYSLTAGDVSVVAVEEGFEGVQVSCKLYSALASGQPVLVIAQPHDDEAQIVDGFDAGISVEQGDVKGVLDAVEYWRSNPDAVRRQGEHARDAFENHFVKEQSVDAYYSMLTEDMPPGSERDTVSPGVRVSFTT